MARMSAARTAGLVFFLMGLPMFLTGGMLAMFLGLEYAFTSLAIGVVFVVVGVVAMAVPVKPRPLPASPPFVASPRVSASLMPLFVPAAPSVPSREPVKIACPDCGASPSRVGPSGLTTCEYCGATYAI